MRALSSTFEAAGTRDGRRRADFRCIGVLFCNGARGKKREKEKNYPTLGIMKWTD